MKVIHVAYRDPNGGLQVTQLDAAEHKVHMNETYCSIVTAKGDYPVKWIPIRNLELVEFGDMKEESTPRLIVPKMAGV